MPAMFENQQTCMNVFSQTFQTSNTGVESQMYSIDHKLMHPKDSSTLPRFKRQHWASHTLKRLGLYQRGSVQYLSGEDSQTYTNHRSENHIISTSREVFLAWGFLHLGLHWSRQHPYRCIPSSLSIHPIVTFIYNHLDLTKYDLMKNAPDGEVRQTLYSGALHPFTRDVRGSTLLEVSMLQRQIQAIRMSF